MEGLSQAIDRLVAHAVDLAFALVVAVWVAYALRITTEVSYWSDDLFLLEQSRSWDGLVEPYNLQLSLVPLAIYRGVTELWGMTYTPVMVAGVLSLAVVPIAYFLTARRRLGPVLAGVLALTMVWFERPSLQPSGLSHHLMLAAAIVCAAALDRGPRADVVLAVALTLSLASAGGGLVVVAACVVHCALVRPHRRRWLAIALPLVVWALWWWLAADAASYDAVFGLPFEDAAQVVRDLCLAPFYAAALGVKPLAWALLGAFVVYGFRQVRRGFAEAAPFLAWSSAMVLWAVALVRSRGILADPQAFRYVYVASGFALLAVVPRRTVPWQARLPLRGGALGAVAACLVLLLGGVRALAVRDDLQAFAENRSVRGREADGTLLVLGLGSEAIPDDTPISFFGRAANRGSAARLRALTAHYGTPSTTTRATADRELVSRRIARAHLGPAQRPDACDPVEPTVVTPGIRDHGTRGAGGREPLRIWATRATTVEVRRFGAAWVPLIDVPEGRPAVITLPMLNSPVPWEVRVDGGCVPAGQGDRG